MILGQERGWSQCPVRKRGRSLIGTHWGALGSLKQKSTVIRYMPSGGKRQFPWAPRPCFLLGVTVHSSAAAAGPLCALREPTVYSAFCAGYTSGVCMSVFFAFQILPPGPWVVGTSGELPRGHSASDDCVYRPLSVLHLSRARLPEVQSADHLHLDYLGLSSDLPGSTYGVEPRESAFSTGEPSLHHVWELLMCSLQ